MADGAWACAGAACHIDELPRDMMLHVLSFLSAQELSLHVSPVCREWHDLAGTPWLWMRLCAAEGFPSPTREPPHTPPTLTEPPHTPTEPPHTPPASTALTSSGRAKFVDDEEAGPSIDWKHHFVRMHHKRERWLHGWCAPRRVVAHEEEVAAVAVTPSVLVTGSFDTTVRVWAAADCALLHTLEGHTEWVSAVAVSEEEGLVCSGSWDATVRVWRLEDGECEWVLRSHASNVRCVALEEGVIASGDANGRVCVWSADTGEPLATPPPHTCAIVGVAVRGGVLTSVASDGSVRRGGVARGECVGEWACGVGGELLCARMAAGDDAVVWCGGEGGVLASVVLPPPHASGAPAAVTSWSRADRRTDINDVFADAYKVVVACEDGRVRIHAQVRDARTRALVALPCTRELAAHVGWVWSVCAHGDVLATAGLDGMLCVYNHSASASEAAPTPH